MDRDIQILVDTSIGKCKLPLYGPCSRGNGNTHQASRLRMYDMCWQMSSSVQTMNLWQTGEVNPAEWVISNNLFDGRFVVPQTTSYAIAASMGSTPEVITSTGAQVSGLPFPTTGYFAMSDSTVKNFVYYTLVNEGGQLVSLRGFPYTSGILLNFVDSLNANTSMVLSNNTFLNLDHNAITARGMINVTLQDNQIINCTGRARSNTAAM